MKNYYAILGCKRGDDASVIRKAYIEKSKQFHPDLGGEVTQFQEISEAWGVLKDDKKRWTYHREMNLKMQKCDACDGKGHINKMKLFGKSLPYRCGECNGSGIKDL